MKLHRQAVINTAKGLGVILAFLLALVAMFTLAFFAPLLTLVLMVIGILSMGVRGIYLSEVERLEGQERLENRKNYLGPDGLATQILDNVRERRKQSQSQSQSKE